MGNLIELTRDVHSVSRLDLVHQVVVSVHDSRVRRLACRHVFGGLLDFDLINKRTDVMTLAIASLITT